MQIDRSNYEIWLIDWLDGNLSDLQIEQLRLFLRDNPDLKEEFEELTTIRVNPSGMSFPYKNQLKKSPADLSETQFEYLSVAYLENDLSADQQAELKETIQNDPEKKKSFELIQKMRLSPVSFSFKHKNRLIKRTVFHKAIRLSLIGLSAAAIITLVIVTYFSRPAQLKINFEKTAQTVTADSTTQKKSPQIVSNSIKTGRHPIRAKKQSNPLIADSLKTASLVSAINADLNAENDSIVVSSELDRTSVNRISLLPLIDLKGEPIPNTLIASNSSVTVPEYDDGRSKFKRFIARTFREKILKENKAKDSPLKGYEFAKAGVSGLDKLLGWEMALDEKKDANGVLKSIYFSSKILKFNAPIKKTEPLP